MKKNIIKKYKKEFDWWLEGGAIEVLLADGKTWIRASSNYVWEDDSCKIVIEDEYCEFRKALAEGKTIEYCTSRSGITFANWETMKTIDYFNRGALYYRIKPEPKFKIGDYVITTGQKPSYERTTFLARVIEENKCKIMQGIPYSNYKSNLSEAKAWEPKAGDLCIFFDDNKDCYISFIIREFKKTVNNIYYCSENQEWENIRPIEYVYELMKEYPNSAYA